MTIRLSTGLRNDIANGKGFQGSLNKGYIKIFSGSQPASADAAEAGTLLGIVTVGSGALTKETRASGTVTLTGGASGTINNITVGGKNIIPDGAVPFNTSLNQTASDLADAINRNGIMEASAASAVVTVKGRPGSGAITDAVAGSLTTITASYAALSGGVAPVNGLTFGPTSLGVLAKKASETWSFNGITNGTAGWFRFYPSDTADVGALISGAPYYSRMDGSVAVSGADLNLSNIAITTGAPSTVDTFNVTMPAA